MSGRTDVRIVLLRRHVLDDLLPLRGSLPHVPGLGCRRLWPVHQRLLRAVRVRRPGRLRHAARQMGRAGDGIHLRGNDGRGRRPGALRHHRRIPARTLDAPRLPGLHVLRAGQRDRRHGGHALDCQVVPSRADGPGDGPAAGGCPARDGPRPGDRPAPGRRERRPRVQPRRDRPSGHLRHGPHGRRAHPLGRVRGHGRPFRPCCREVFAYGCRSRRLGGEADRGGPGGPPPGK